MGGEPPIHLEVREFSREDLRTGDRTWAEPPEVLRNDPRFAAADYRTSQNYVGEAVAWQKERIHFACPKPEDLPGLMEGLRMRR